MSAGGGEYPGEPPVVISADLGRLAPAFRAAVEAGLAECRAKGIDAIVHEAYRANETQAIYYARGRTTIPPRSTVTNARTNVWSWHGYGLAVDIISASKGWNAGSLWFSMMAEIMKRHGCKWGGDWKDPDTPHIQWGPCKASPSDRARALLATGGMPAVWAAVSAL